jgi:hypothetical protein
MAPPQGPDRDAGRYLRVAGRSALGDGRVLVWSMAEGRRGRRWRASVLRGDDLLAVVLLEVTPDGRPSRLELTTRLGALTLHPEPDEGSIHGNIIDVSGVRPLAFAWSPAHEIELAGSPLGRVVTIARRGRDLGVGEGTEFPVLVVGDDLSVSEGRRAIALLGDASWRVTDDVGAATEVVVDQDGLPAAEATWELEPAS